MLWGVGEAGRGVDGGAMHFLSEEASKKFWSPDVQLEEVCNFGQAGPLACSLGWSVARSLKADWALGAS